MTPFGAGRRREPARGRIGRASRWGALAFGVALGGCATPPAEDDPIADPYPRDGELRVNHVQAKGTHDSYHIAPSEDTIEPWAYTHAPLGEQLGAQGARQVELDV